MLIQSYLPVIGGAEKQIDALGPFLQALDVEVHVLTRRYDGLKSFEVINGIPVHRIPIAGGKATKAIMYILNTLKTIHSLKPDLIHAHELLSPATTAIFAKWYFRLPVLAKVLRGGEPLGDVAKISAGILGRWRRVFISKNINAFAVISQEIDRELAEMNVEKQRRFFLPNGVDVNRFHPVSQEQKLDLRSRLSLPSGPIVIYSGRLQPEKRVSQLLDVWEKVRMSMNGAHLIILGTGPEEEMLKKKAGDGVKLLGSVEDVSPYLQASDVYVLPSSTEGLSNSLLEAMACGLPVIATNVGGAPDLIVDRERGLLIKPDSPEQLERACVTLLNDVTMRELCGRSARNFVVENYALENMAIQMRSLYDLLLEGVSN
jgi:glycosyltransferase involved in cell wall biosynthesis